ncbi:MAG: efflux RND transporter periplasmic adaptor subunit [Acidobacteria bacterium]|nr:efflux RND transporter periplasmic adaptor subunit [Acidobacteriota bacterium]
MKRILGVLALLLVAAGVWWSIEWRNAPPVLEFSKTTRETIVDQLSTNGKIEPVQWEAARNESAGVVRQVHVRKGQLVKKGDALIEIETREAKAAVEAANARIAQVRAELDTIGRGGRAAELSSIDSSLGTARQELATAQREAAELERLVAKQAATPYELTVAKQRVDAARTAVQGLESRRGSLVGAADRSSAEARLREAESSKKLAEQQVALGTVRAPMAGVVYQVDVRAGDYIAPGTLVASVGKVEQVRALIYVDEPELGRVGEGKPVTVTWDALPGREWKGTVQKVPTVITALGSRQVGEVECVIENPDQDLLPGSNINAFIQAAVVPNAVAVSKAALRRENNETGVYALRADGKTIEWRPVKLGVSSLVRAQVISGLKDGEAVAMPTDRPLKTGMEVAVEYR